MALVAGVALALSALGFYLGLEGLLSGETLVRPRNAQPYVAYADGPHAPAFYTYTVGFVLMGVLFLGIAAAVIRSLRAATTRQR